MSVLAVAGVMAVGAAALHAAQAAPAAPRPPMAEDVFTNVQVMKGVPADQFLASMGFMSNALAVNCTYCHLGEGGGGWTEYAKDNDKKRMARRMITMVNGINQMYFGTQSVGTQSRVTCVTCHNASNRPKTSPNMSTYYSVPTSDEPEQITAQADGAPSVDQVFAKYLTAIGGAQKAAALTSFVAKGTDLGYGDAEPAPLQVFAKSPNQFSEVVNTGSGPRARTFDGRAGWMIVPEAYTPLPQRSLTGAELEGAKLDAALLFPSQIKAALTNWRGAYPAAIDDTDVNVIQGTMANGFPVKLFFEDESGLLVRQMRYIETPIGRATWQIEYSDYRDVAGVKIPFKRTLLWQSGKQEIVLSDIQANVPVDAARFARPATPAPARR